MERQSLARPWAQLAAGPHWPMGAQNAQLGASLRAGRRAEVVEEGCDVAAEQAGLLGGWEVAAAGQGVHRRMLYRRSAHSRGGVPSSMN